jgi:hypothetical protein
VLEEYIKEIGEDLKFDEINLKEYQLRLPALKHKWAGRCIRHKLQLSQLKHQRLTLRKDLVEAANKAAPVVLPIRDLEKKVESHTDILNIDNKIKELDLVIELLEKAEKTFNSTTWDISNLIKIVASETQ